jgi:hypothetical protein
MGDVERIGWSIATVFWNTRAVVTIVETSVGARRGPAKTR